ncbi:MAG: hypothetical protein HZB76_06375 [Chlamydiae bacterium]|nr:hypothetical protein [Chlamydiota bacterium]
MINPNSANNPVRGVKPTIAPISKPQEDQKAQVTATKANTFATSNKSYANIIERNKTYANIESALVDTLPKRHEVNRNSNATTTKAKIQVEKIKT